MTLVPLPAFADNYIWMLHAGSSAIVADPVDARPGIDALPTTPPPLAAILVKHHDANRVLRPTMLPISSGRRVSCSRVPLFRIPFLRSREATVIATVHEHSGKTGSFATLRQWKNDFR